MQRARKKVICPTEELEQIKFSTWLTKQNIKHYAIPNGGKRSISEGIRFKASGVQSGIPDICIPIPSESYHGLYIELKRVKGSKLSDNQIYWLEFLRSQGYYAEIAYGCSEAIEIVTHYLCLANPAPAA